MDVVKCSKWGRPYSCVTVFNLRGDTETDRHRGKNTGSQGENSLLTGVIYLKSEQYQKSWQTQDTKAGKDSPSESLQA